MSDEKKKVDEDWKRRAQVEKEADAAKFTPKADEGGAAPKGPEARQTLAPLRRSDRIAGVAGPDAHGRDADPMTGEVHQDMRQAQATIELLNVLEEKTKGNLVKEEEDMLKQVVTEVRMHFVKISQAASAPPPAAPPE